MKKSQKKPSQKQITAFDISLVNELLAGGRIDTIAKKGNITSEELLQLKERVLLFFSIEQLQEARKNVKIGRNDPCPCGSGKKYKNCCMGKEREESKQTVLSMISKIEAEEKEREKKITNIVQEALNLFSTGKYHQSIDKVAKVLREHPHEDRLHDVLQLSLIYLNRPAEAVKICRSRWLEAVKDKTFIRTHGYPKRTRDEIAPASPGFPPTAWLSKYWVSLKALEYSSQKQLHNNPEITDAIFELKSADDLKKFPQTQNEGLKIRKKELSEVSNKLIQFGDIILSEIAPFTYRYSWTCLMLPDILSALNTDKASLMLIDIVMFQIPYASEASMKHLVEKGPAIIPLIRRVLGQNKEFDPIKTGLISVLAMIKHPDSFELLMGLLNHPDVHVVNWTGGALAQYGDVSALPKMKAARNRIGSEPRLEWGIEQLENLKNRIKS